MTPSRDISRLLEIMAALRTPVTGCPWDLEQNFATIVPYTIEEAYEVADAITRGDFDDLRDELGDLLLQVVYHARMAEEQNAFAFGDVVEAITRKMIRRHPHVFADKDGNIAARRRQERLGAHQGRGKGRARGAAAAGRDGAQIAALDRQGGTACADARDGVAAQGVHCRLRLERSPRGAAARSAKKPTRSRPRSTAADADELAEETGDLLFALVNLARHVGADPESALRGTNAKFERRFAYIERALAAKRPLARRRNARRDGRAVERGESARESCRPGRTQGPIPRI